MNCKKLLAFALTAALFVSACTNVFAAAVAALQMTVSQPVDLNVDQSPEGVVVAEDEVVSMRETQVQANAGKTSGTCGASLKWNYNTSSCVLTISGSGAMKKWSFSDAKPWETYKKKIKKVIINDGVTSIGDYAFNQHSGITHVTIPTSVKSIGISAFESCTALTELYIPDSVTYIGDGAFCACHCLKKITIPATAKVASDCIFLVNGCSSLTEIAIPNTVKEIGFAAFGGCSSLKSIIVPKSIQVVYKQAFSGCEQLKDVYYAGSQSDWRGISVDNRGNESFYCNATVHYNYKAPSTASIASIAIVKKPSKQTYTAGETFTSAGMKLKVTYSDNTTKEITSGFTCTPSGKLNTVGQQKIVVTYGGKSTGFYVTVNKAGKAVNAVAIVKKPSKQTYTVGETFTSAGMKLKVTYSDNTTKEITSDFTCTPSGKLNTVGQQKIVVTYGGKSTGFYVTVNKAGKAVNAVAIVKKPSKQTYTVGETFTSAGMKLKVTYSDNTTKEITSGFTCTPSGKLNTVGQQKIVVSYGGKSTGFYVTVNKAVSSIAVNTKPTKQTYTAGDTLNTAGMKIKVTYTDKTTKVITKGFTCSPTKLNTAGQQKITVSYGGKTTNFTVKVNKKTTKVKSIAISNKPSTLSYRKGETLKTSGMKLKVTYTDGTSKVITSGFTCSPTKLNTAGKQKITVSYGGKTTTFTVTVSSLQKITQSNVATVLEKQIRWYAAYRNSFTWHSFKKTGRNIAFTDSYGVEYYRVYDYNSIKEVQNELSKYMIVPTNCVKQRSLLKEKSGKLYAMEFYGGVVAYDLKSVTLKEFKNNAYYVYVNVYEVTEYYTKDLLKVVEKDGQYKIESFVEGNTDYDAPRDMDSHPERYHLVAGLGD